MSGAEDKRQNSCKMSSGGRGPDWGENKQKGTPFEIILVKNNMIVFDRRKCVNIWNIYSRMYCEIFVLILKFFKLTTEIAT